MNIRRALLIAVSLTVISLTVYMHAQSALIHITAISPSSRKQSDSHELPRRSESSYQEAKNDYSTSFITAVIADHTWQSALHQFQLTLDKIREKFINDFKSQISRCVSCNNTTIIFDEFLNVEHRLALKNLSKVNSLVGHVDVSWFGDNETNKSVVTNLPTQRMFKPFATPPVCGYLPNKVWQQIISCSPSEIDQSAPNLDASSIAITNGLNKLLRRSPLQYFFSESLYSYVNIFANASINDIGSIKACDGCVTVLPIACRTGARERFIYDERDSRVRIVDEVFTIAQYWGYGYFHAAIENLPRVAPYVEFLQRHPHIRLHVALNSNYDQRTAKHVSASLAALGIDPKRLVSGHVRAKIAYLPRGTPCGYALKPELQILSWRLHNYIANSLNETQHSSVVLIIRQASKNKRNMARSTYTLINDHLRTFTKDGPLKLELFDDRHRLSHSDTLRMFYRARIVIGIHGAGLANIIYSRPGTQVIEMLCHPPDTVMCFANTALILGHRYHAFPVNNCAGNSSIDTQKFLTVLDHYVGAETETMQAG